MTEVFNSVTLMDEALEESDGVFPESIHMYTKAVLKVLEKHRFLATQVDDDDV